MVIDHEIAPIMEFMHAVASMSDKAFKVVWVLGTGFSAPLGAPTLDNLLAPWRLNHARFVLGNDSQRIIDSVTRLFGTDDERNAGQRPWRNAEELLDYVDAARLTNIPLRFPIAEWSLDVDPASASLQANENIENISKELRQTVAAVCYSSLQYANPNSESWQPYTLWFKELQPQDTVITFNYDLALEMLLPCDPRRAHIRSPNWFSLSAEDRNRQGDWPGTPILKLHGSVDWIFSEQPLKKAMRQPITTAEWSPPENVAIATPGPTKGQEAVGPFFEMWNFAKQCLREANAVVFVGYRFPETDALARMELLGALAERSDPETADPLVYHLVLGSDLGSKDIRRLEGLLKWSLRTRFGNGYSDRELYKKDSENRSHKFSIESHPLFSQDFLSVVKREHLYPFKGFAS